MATASCERLSGVAPARFPPLHDAVAWPDPYASGAMFHGPTFRHLTELLMGANGSTSRLDAAAGQVPRGNLHQSLLDAATHGIPHADLHLWVPGHASHIVGFPYRLAWIRLWQPLPDRGEVQAEARFAGFDEGNPERPAFDVQMCRDAEVLVELRLVDHLVPAGPIATAPPGQRLRFLGEREWVPGMGLASALGSRTEDDLTRLVIEADPEVVIVEEKAKR